LGHQCARAALLAGYRVLAGWRSGAHRLRRAVVGWGMVVHDQARAHMAGQNGPHPLKEDADGKAGLAKKLEMYRGSGLPTTAMFPLST